jgi:hypothetical protein
MNTKPVSITESSSVFEITLETRISKKGDRQFEIKKLLKKNWYIPKIEYFWGGKLM